MIGQPLFSIPLCPQPFEGLLPNPNPVHSDVLSSHLFFCLPFLLLPYTVPCRIIFASPVDLVICPYHLNLRFLTMVIRSSYGPIACLIVFFTSSFCNMIPVGDVQKSSEAIIACIFLSNSAVRIHDSHAYRKIEMDKERIILILELRAMFLSFHNIF